MLGFVCRKAAVPELRAAIANNEDELEVMVMCKKKKGFTVENFDDGKGAGNI